MKLKVKSHSSVHTPGENHNSKKDLSVHCSTMYNSQDMQTT